MTDHKTTCFTVVHNLLEAKSIDLERVRSGVVAIGNFDGVHKGHRVVLDTAYMLASRNGDGSKTLAMTFEPHPRTVFNPEKPVFRLTPFEAKAKILEAMGLNGVAQIPFDQDFASMRAEAFVKDLLVEKLAVQHVVVGYDFHFGKDREGSPEFLMEMGKRHGFAVSIVPAQRDESGELVFSSSAVRAFLARGQIEDANAILGYRYFVSGEIIHGEKRGRDLGFPTANMVLAPENDLRHGVYAVQMRIEGTLYDGVASFGRRPTFDNGAPLLETFLLDFEGDLYGQTVDVAFVRFLRAEEKFGTLDALIAQMQEDSKKARKALQNDNNGSQIDSAMITNQN